MFHEGIFAKNTFTAKFARYGVSWCQSRAPVSDSSRGYYDNVFWRSSVICLLI
jgi:hypothetical protein